MAIIMGIYWNNHHHLLHAAKHVTPRLRWANLHLLYWLSVIPLVSGWLGESPTAVPTALYGLVMALAAGAYRLVSLAVVPQHGPGSRVAEALSSDVQGLGSFAAYVAAIPLAFVSPWIADAIYVAVALVWPVPDTRLSRAAKSD
jgi:uncharacterized membrane protein